MATKRVMCVTWNLELQCPDNAALTESFVTTIRAQNDANRPNVIVIGLQETASYDTIAATFIGNKLVVNTLLGNAANFNNNPYVLLGTARFKGITKKGQIFGKKAQQAIQVLVRQADQANIAGDFDAYQKAWQSEKGFVFADLNCYGKRLGFVSTHLAADSDESRRKGCQTISNAMGEYIGDGGKFSALFMMGDLNYRLRRMNSTTPAATETQLIINMMVNRGGRMQLRTYDTFDAGTLNLLPFMWPPHDQDCFPTYKRSKSNSDYGVIRQLKYPGGVMDNQGKVTNVNALKTIYAKEGAFKEKRAGVWDFGWLDRIGYAVYAPGYYNPDGNAGLLKAGLTIAGNQADIAMQGWNHVPYGDHMPVYCQFDLNGF